MTVISFTGTGLLDRIAASRTALASPPGRRQGAALNEPTRVTLGRSAGAGAVYSDPRANPAAGRIWASPVKDSDTISTLMARNRGLASYTLADQWRGLGGALLTRFGKTGESYTQTLVDEGSVATDNAPAGLTPEAQAGHAAEIQARQAAALANVATDAPAAALTIKTRSGQSVELKIAVSAGVNGLVGMKVEVQGSGPMSDDERAAVQKLAEGLDRALEGLGRDDAVGLDLSGLMAYDRATLASVDLTVNNTSTHQVLGSFSLHLGDDKRTIALKGSDGEMRLNVDAKAPPGGVPGQAALQRTLARLDAAGERGRANAALVEQMKAAFQHLQGAAGAAGAAGSDDEAVASRLSGLADFDASFGGETWRSNRFGSHNEAGQVDYQLSQMTTTKPDGRGGKSTAQTVSEQLSADYKKAPGDGMLDVATGNFTATQVRDRSTVTTRVDTAANGAIHVLRKTDEQQLKTVTDWVNHRAVNRQSWPAQRSWVERLG